MINQLLRNIVTKSSITLALFLLIGTISAAAQTGSAEQIKVNVPFEFSVRDERMPAGVYTIKRTSQAELAYVIQDRDRHHVAVSMVKNKVQGGRKSSDAKLVFDVYEGKYFLTQVWSGASNTGSEVYQSRARREVSRGSAPTQTVILVASR